MAVLAVLALLAVLAVLAPVRPDVGRVAARRKVGCASPRASRARGGSGRTRGGPDGAVVEVQDRRIQREGLERDEEGR
jgi:hypothetical protein